MPRKAKVADLDELVRRYKADATATDLAKEFHLNRSFLIKRLRELNALRDRSETMRLLWRRRRRPFIPEESVQWYLQGMSEKAIAMRLGISRGTFREYLLVHGVTVRGRSEAERIKWLQMPEAKRQAQVAAAHLSTKGMRRTITDLHARALSRQKNLTQQSPTERQIISMLIKRSITDLTPQLALGPYNVDIAIHIPPVAVEVYGHNTRKATSLFAHKKKIPYLLNQGWHVLAIIIDGGERRLTEAAANYIVTFLQSLRRAPPLWCEYRVIGGNGKLNPTLSNQLYGGSIIGSSVGRLDT